MLKRPLSRNPYFILTLALFFIGSTFGVNFAVSQPQGIRGCVDKASGALRIATKCKSTERSIQWSIFGPQGPKGDKGDTGEKGEKGIRGFTVLGGSEAPDLEVGIDGDFYIDHSSYKIYGPKRDGLWGSPRDIIGPKGDVGAPGPKGDKGDVGAVGPRGSTGLTGSIGPQGERAGFRYVYDSDENLIGKFRGFWNQVYFIEMSDGRVWQFDSSGSVKKLYIYWDINSCGTVDENGNKVASPYAAIRDPSFNNYLSEPVISSFVRGADLSIEGANRVYKITLSSIIGIEPNYPRYVTEINGDGCSYDPFFNYYPNDNRFFSLDPISGVTIPSDRPVPFIVSD